MENFQFERIDRTGSESGFPLMDRIERIFIDSKNNIHYIGFHPKDSERIESRGWYGRRKCEPFHSKLGQTVKRGKCKVRYHKPNGYGYEIGYKSSKWVTEWILEGETLTRYHQRIDIFDCNSSTPKSKDGDIITTVYKKFR